MQNYQTELEVAKRAAKVAAEIIARYFMIPDLEVKHKNPQQPVTAADIEANQAIVTILKEAFPDDAILSEESPDDLSRLQKSRVWILDPLDGTRDFIEKNPEFGVSIALVCDQNPVVGVIVNPATSEMFWASQGAGAFDREGPLKIKAYDKSQKPELLVSRSEFKRGEWDKYKNDFVLKPTGGSAYKMGLVAKGVAHACFTLMPKSEWDVAAGAVIISEAGGVCSLASGEPILFNQQKIELPNFFYGNAAVFEVIKK